jgi:hypothetical protein
MANGWFVTIYERKVDPNDPNLIVRAPRISNLFAQQIHLDKSIRPEGGELRFLEGLGHSCVARVRFVAPALLTTIGQDSEIDRIPGAILDDPLSSLTGPQKTRIQQRLLQFGYPIEEIQTRFSSGDLANYTLGDVLRFVLRRRRKVRFDQGTQTIVDDGPEQPVVPIEQL